jgi:hypothetical protein
LTSPTAVTYDALVPTPRRTPASRQVNFRLPADAWERLDAAAGVLGVPQSRIIADALQIYFEAMPKSKRQVIDDAIALRRKP